MTTVGDVYYGRQTFADGGSSVKFIIILHANELSNRVISCIVTSVPIDKNKTSGCHPKTQRFLIPINTEGFTSDTFLEMFRFREYSYADFTENVSKKLLSYERTLSPGTIKLIKECYKKLASDLSPDYIPLITL